MDPVLRYLLWVTFCGIIALLVSSLESMKSEQQKKKKILLQLSNFLNFKLCFHF
jgi:hypothetical protein